MCWAIDTERFEKLSVSLDVLGHRHRNVSETFSQSGCIGPQTQKGLRNFQSVWMYWAIDTERFQKLSVSLDVLGHRHRNVSETFSQSGSEMPMGSHKKSGTTFCGEPVIISSDLDESQESIFWCKLLASLLDISTGLGVTVRYTECPLAMNISWGLERSTPCPRS